MSGRLQLAHGIALTTTNMSEVKHIDGWISGHTNNGPGYELGGGAGWADFWEGNPTHRDPTIVTVTVTIFPDGKRQRLFTEQEVRMALSRFAHFVEGKTGAWVSPSDITL